MRHGEGNVLPVAVGQDVLLFGNPLFGAFQSAAAAGFGLTGLGEEARMRAICRTAAVAAYAHGAGTTGEHALDGEFGPVAEQMTVFVEEAFPALIVLEKKLCRSRYVHNAEYKMRR